MDITDYNPQIMDIFSREVLSKIESGEEGWEEMLPAGVAEIIKEKSLFGCKTEQAQCD